MLFVAQKKICVCCLGVMGNCLCRFEPFNHKVSANAKSGLRFCLFFLDLVFCFLETLYQCHGFFLLFSPEITRFSYGLYFIPKKLSQNYEKSVGYIPKMI